MGWKEAQERISAENRKKVAKTLQASEWGKGLRIKDMLGCGLSRPTILSHLKGLRGLRKAYRKGKLWFWLHPKEAVIRQLQRKLEIISQNDLLLKALFQDTRFQELLLEKMSEGLQVREDIVENKILKEVKLHTFTEKIRPKKQGL